MKKYHFTLAVCALLFCLIWSCSSDSEFKGQPQQPQAAFYKTAPNPEYSQSELQSIISDHETEEAFMAKTELLTYAFTRFLGEHGGLKDGSALRVVIPCDLGLADPDGSLRMMSQASGMNPDQVKVSLSATLVSCLKYCTLSQQEQDHLFDAVLESLTMEGDQYDLSSTYSESVPSSYSQKIFLSYGIGEIDGEIRAFGFVYNLVDKSITRTYLAPEEAQELDMLLLDTRIISGGGNAEQVNDPCYYALGGGYNGGGGTGGGGAGGGGTIDLDDDGANKNVVPGPMVTPDPQFDTCDPQLSPKDGLRVVKFHLADRNEGGLFGGKSEVYMGVSVYRSSWPDQTIRTNTEGEHHWVRFDLKNEQCWLSDGPGKVLSTVPKSDIGIGNPTLVSEPSPGDWTIMESGFCEGSGYNRVFLVFYEHDPVSGDGDDWHQLTHSDLTAPDICDLQYLKMSQPGDTWFENSGFALRPLDFINNNGTLWLTEIPGGFLVETSQPTNDFSWFEVELY